MEAKPRPVPKKKKPPLTDRTNNFIKPPNLPYTISDSPVFPNPSSRSTPNRGNKSGNSVEPVYRRNKVTEKTKDEEEKTSMPLTIYSDEKRTVKGKSAAAPTGKIKDAWKMIPIPVSCTSMVNTRNKTKENVEPFSFPPFPRTRKRREMQTNDNYNKHANWDNI